MVGKEKKSLLRGRGGNPKTCGHRLRGFGKPFSEILRKGDEIPYLAEMLLDKLKAILQKKNTNQISYEDLKNYAAQNFYKTPSEDSEGPDISR